MRDRRNQGWDVSRIPLIRSRDELDADGRLAFDAIVESRGSMLRPFEVLLHAPSMAARVAELGHAIRFDSGLSDADRELVTLATGRARACSFIWGSHLEAAREAGIGPDVLETLQSGEGNLDSRRAALVSLVRELCSTGEVADETFRAVHELVGTRGVVELVLTVGYYSMLAATMGAVEAC